MLYKNETTIHRRPRENIKQQQQNSATFSLLRAPNEEITIQTVFIHSPLALRGGSFRELLSWVII